MDFLKRLFTKQHIPELIAIALCIPAFVINLGLLPYIEDEAIRALVALEMLLSGDFITPRLGQAMYFNKPPLYNWIIALFFKLSGQYNELVSRIPTILFLGVYAITIYYFVKKHFNKQSGFLAAFIFLTCGRILFWDSFLGLIDICFSWLIFSLFMVIFTYYKKQDFFRLFLFSWIITSLTFMMKGLPALAFQGITLLAIFIDNRQFKKLFAWQNFFGFFVFLCITGLYYLIYHYRNPGYIERALLTLLHESTDKSATGFSILPTLKHMLAFPFEMSYHFLPWSIGILLLFIPGSLKKCLQNPFIRYCIIVFFSNIIVYWISPVTYPRYLLMLVPLMFIVYVFIYQENKDKNHFMIKIVHAFFIIALLLAALGVWAGPFLEKTKHVEMLWLKTISISFALFIIAYLFYKNKNKALVFFIIGMLAIRIWFNWFIIPSRVYNSFDAQLREESKAVGRLSKGRDLYIAHIFVNYQNIFYITAERKKNLSYNFKFNKPGYYIIFAPNIKNENYDQVATMHIKHEKQKCRVIKVESGQ